ncbi:MAG: tetratricopeptide repeat protein [Treponema sp.]|nr:tetratricopeptide repeat protein [Treponema sp.]
MKMTKKLKYFANITIKIIIIFTFTSCEFVSGLWYGTQEVDKYFLIGTNDDKEYLKELFNLLTIEEQGSEAEFAVTREIAAYYGRLKNYDRMIHFLSSRTINNPHDPYNGYYFLMIAYANMQQGSAPIAALFFDLILKNYPDLLINNESIHLICLQNLINLNKNPEHQVWYYRELISRFPEKIDLAAAYFMLGQACEAVGDWNGAIQAYTNYLPFSGAIITGFPDADRYAKQLVDFSRSQKDWTFESLQALRSAVQEALEDGDSARLSRYQAKVNFFARSWEQIETDEAGMTRFNLAQFMYGNRIRFASELDESSNTTEAFLRTTGWSQPLSTWYFYFRKIYFPQEPEIHGNWEWVGIYYGEKF